MMLLLPIQEFNFHTEKRSNNNPPTELFSKVNLEINKLHSVSAFSSFQKFVVHNICAMFYCSDGFISFFLLSPF